MNLKDKKGISLIVLVITIVVIIILAVAVILTIADNNPISNARQAVDANNVASLKEEAVMLYSKWYVEQKLSESPTTQTADEYVKDNLQGNYSDELIDGLTVADDGTITINTEDDTEVTKTPVVPEGFIHVEGTTVATGYVIKNSTDGNEFVWIPVDDITTFTTLENGYKNTLENGNLTLVKQNFTGNYDISSTSNSILKTDKIDLNIMAILDDGGYVEPKDDADIIANRDKLQKQFIDEYNAMLESVKKYGGFYVGRYETSIDSNGKVSSIAISEENSDTHSVFTTKTELLEWQCINSEDIEETGEDTKGNKATWYGLYKKQKELYPKTSKSLSVVSGMIYGCQWDAIMKWLKDEPNPNATDYTYIQNSLKMGVYFEEYSEKQNTGKYNVKNIYDLAGNYSEFTQEAYDIYRIARGGNNAQYGAECPVSYRVAKTPIESNIGYGSRLQIYIK